MKDKELLRAIYVASLAKQKTSARELSQTLDIPRSEVAASLSSMAKERLVEYNGPSIQLTPRGRRRLKVVFIGGAFEVIHPGHLYTIQQAKKRGDVLVVVVARDSTVRKRKKREPIAPEEERVRMVGAIRQVDAAILGSETNIYDTLERVGPDIVALGYDQYHSEEDILREAKMRDIEISVVRLDSPFPALKTSRILTGL